MMTIEQVLDWIVKIAIAVGAWLWASLVGKVNKLGDKHEAFEKKVLEQYVKKEDFQRSSDRVYTAINDMQKDIKSDLAAISAKLDTKQDK